jgi:hypothetical protein
LDLFSRAGIAHATAVAVVPGEHQLGEPARFWDIVLGSGYRATVDALSPDQHDQVRGRLPRRLRAGSATVLRTDVVFGTVIASVIPKVSH